MRRTIALPVALGLLLTTQVAAEDVPQPNAGAAAATVFQEVCLATRGKGMAAAVAAILARTGVKEGQNLPGYGTRAAPMRTFTDSEHRDYLIRPDKNGRYGCFVLLETPKGEAAEQFGASAKTVLDQTPGLIAKLNNQKKIEYYDWSIAGSKDDIRLTPDSGIGGVLINLDVR